MSARLSDLPADQQDHVVDLLCVSGSECLPHLDPWTCSLCSVLPPQERGTNIQKTMRCGHMQGTYEIYGGTKHSQIPLGPWKRRGVAESLASLVCPIQ